MVSTHLLASSMSAVALAIQAKKNIVNKLNFPHYFSLKKHFPQFFASSDTSPLYVVLLATVAKFGTTAAFALIILQVK